jgi:hypothetical protein
VICVLSLSDGELISGYKQTIKDQAARIKELEVKVEAAASDKVAAVATKENELLKSHQIAVDSAYDKGYARCKEAMADMKKLLQD